MATQISAQTWSMMALTSAYANACKSKDPDRIRETARDLEAAKTERQIRTSLLTEHGLRDEDRQRLAALLLDGGDDQ